MVKKKNNNDEMRESQILHVAVGQGRADHHIALFSQFAQLVCLPGELFPRVVGDRTNRHVLDHARVLLAYFSFGIMSTFKMPKLLLMFPTNLRTPNRMDIFQSKCRHDLSMRVYVFREMCDQYCFRGESIIRNF